MAITSYNFILFSVISVFIFYLLNRRYRIHFLAALSCIFIAGYSYLLLIYIVLYALANYFLGILMPQSKYKIVLFRTGILLNISQLVVLRYASFAIDPLLEAFNSNLQVSKLAEILIPIGISYFTLQGIGYLINLKMGWEKPEKSFLNFFLYITFFPKFLSGPVERSNHFLPQLNEARDFDEQQVTEGLRIALMGFFKKIAIANQLAPYALSNYGDMSTTDGYTSWILFLIQPLYLYFDFSGYTDIAIGISKTFGINLVPNFNRPFFAENMTTFWKRFHISLSSWFNDYVFRQTSFRYRSWGIYASAYAVFLTFMLFGIWHGAGWTFMVVGLLQAIAINYEFFTKRLRLKLFSHVPAVLTVWIGRVTTYLFYSLSLVFFFSADINSAMTFLSRLTEVGGPVNFGPVSTKPISVMFYIPLLMLLEFIENDYGGTYRKLELFWKNDSKRIMIFRWSIYSLIITLIFVVGGDVQQFIYANF